MKKSLARFLSIALAVALVVTCAITGLVLPTAADTEAQTSVSDEPVNLLSQDYPFTLEYGKNFSNGGRNYTLSEPLAAGEKLMFRFEAKGAPISASCSAGTWNRVVKTYEYDEWHSYQQSFPVATASVGKNTVWVSWTPDWANAEEGDKIEVRNLRVYKVTSALNLIGDGDMENGFFDLLEKSASGVDEGGVRAIVEDPTGADNKVFQLSKTNSYWNLGTVYDDISYSAIYKIRFRLKGHFRFTRGYTYTPLNNPGSRTTSTGDHTYYSSADGWTTFEFFTCPTSSAFPSYLQFCASDGSNRDCWLDDIELYEVGRAESWTIDKTVKMSAVWNNNASLSNFIKTTPVNSYPFGDAGANPFTWTLVGGTTNVTLANPTCGWLKNAGGDYSLANEKPELTVTDGTTTKNVKVEWAYPEYPIANATFNDIVGDKHVWTTSWNAKQTFKSTAGKGMDGSAAGYATAATGTVYINQRLVLQPNTTYRFSMLVKASSGTVKVGFSNFKDCTSTGTITHNATGEWTRVVGGITTGAAPIASGNSGININFTPASGDAAPEAIIDNVLLERRDAAKELLLDGDFEIPSSFEKSFPTGAISFVDASQAEGGSIGGNTTKVLKVPAGTTSSTKTAVPQTYLRASSPASVLQVGKAYKLTFKHYGGAATFEFVTYLSDNVRGGGGTLTCKASDEWVEYTYNYVPGADSSSGNHPYRIRLAAAKATSDAYFDDFKVEEIKNTVYAPYSNATLGVGHSDNFWLSGVDAVTGQAYSGQRVVWDMSVGTKLYFSFVPNGKAIPIPTSLKVHYEDGTVVPILNTHHTPMTGSDGTVFGPIEVREGTAYIEYNFAAESTGYQWGTLGSAVRRDVETEEVNGIRFLNRLYMNGLDWANAEGFTVTIDGKAWTVKEIGALARVATDDDSVLDLTTATKRGLCYQAGGDGKVRVTDYTKRYFDFTVVIPVDAADYDTEYEFCAYMVLTDGTTEETVYTEANTDSVTAALGRGA